MKWSLRGEVQSSQMTVILLVELVAIGLLNLICGGDPNMRPVLDACNFLVGILYCALGFLYIHALIHELGHYLAGKIKGFELTTFYTKPLMINRTPAGWKYSLQPKVRILGFVSMAPKDEESLVGRFLFFLAGGVVANFIVGVLSAGFFWMQLNRGVPVSSPLMVLLGVWSWISLYFAIYNSMPLTKKGMDLDGKLFLQLRKNGPAAMRTIAILMLSRELHSGRQSKDWAPHMVEALKGPEDESSREVISLLYRCAYFEGVKDFDTCAGLLLRLEAILDKNKGQDQTPLLQQTLLYCAFESAWRKRDLGAASRFLERVKPVEKAMLGYRAMVDSVVELRKGDLERAAQFRDEAESRMREQAAKSGFSFEQNLELLEEIKNEIIKRQTSSEPPVIVANA